MSDVDLTEKASAETIKLTGADSNGVETNYAKVDTNGSFYQVMTGPSAAASNFFATVNGFNRFLVATDPSEVFLDKFDSGTIDTTDRWTTTVSGTGSLSVASGSMVATAGTTASSVAALVSLPSFIQRASVALNWAATLKFESGTRISNTHRFWGMGTAGSNTVAAPLSDAVGFEIDSSGNLNAVIYVGGVKSFNSTLSGLTDGALHRYTFQWRSDKVVFYIDSADGPVAISTNVIPNTQNLPIRIHSIDGTSTPTAAPQLSIISIGITDQGHNNIMISDSKFGFRQTTVSRNGDLQTRDGLVSGIQNIAISVGGTAVEAKVGASRLTNRKSITVTPTNGVVYWGTSGVTVATGTPIFKNQSVTIVASDSVPIYLISAGTVDTRLVEGA